MNRRAFLLGATALATTLPASASARGGFGAGHLIHMRFSPTPMVDFVALPDGQKLLAFVREVTALDTLPPSPLVLPDAGPWHLTVINGDCIAAAQTGILLRIGDGQIQPIAPDTQELSGTPR